MKLIILFIGVLLTGLSAGFFYAWAVSVIPGTRKITDFTYLETMQSINKEILNPLFFIIFFGSLILMIFITFQHFGKGIVFLLVLLASLSYLFGTFGVTAFGNVPLNNQLEALSLRELSTSGAAEFRVYFERQWNRLHKVISHKVCQLNFFLFFLSLL